MTPLEQTSACGVRLDFASGAALGLLFRDLGASRLLTLERYEPPKPGATESTSHGPAPGTKTKALRMGEAVGEMPFALQVDDGGVTLEVGGERSGTAAPEPSALTGVSLFVRSGTVRFSDVVVRRPAR
jgi:hypothetical protein